jgi:hypothetical protein
MKWFNKKQKLTTRWIVVKTLKEVKQHEIRGFTPENVVAIFKTFESAQKFMKESDNMYGYMQAYPLIIEI